MLLNANQVIQFLNTRGLGAKAQVGYDLTIKEVKRINGGMVLADKTVVEDYTPVLPTQTPTGKIIFKLEPDTYSITFEQGIKLDLNHSAFIRHRSSVLRNGGIITSGVYDPNFEVEEMGAILVATKPLSIEKGARVAQVVIFENYLSEAYNGQFQKSGDIK
jgi:deoxycytidine triphosphate deaminase